MNIKGFFRSYFLPNSFHHLNRRFLSKLPLLQYTVQRAKGGMFVICILMLFNTKSNAQYDHVWVFGNNVGIDFSSGTAQAIQTNISDAYEASASICDKDGRLLFYTNGTSVWDRNHNLMPNGTDLPKIDPNYTSRTEVTSSSSQGTVIVPMPGNIQKYYVFSLGMGEERSYYYGRLYYSIVDMSRNGGLGDVIAASKGTLLDTLLTEHMTAVKGDHCNIWLLVASRSDTTFKAYSIGLKGIDPTPSVSKIEAIHATGYIAVAPDRSKLAISMGDLALYDFHPGTGKITNPLFMIPKDVRSYYGVEFSPNSKILYATRSLGISQFDLSSNNNAAIAASMNSITNIRVKGIKAAPDGKIYISGSPERPYFLDVIHQPNIFGSGCQFTAQSFNLQSNANSRARLNLGNKVVAPVFLDTIFTISDSFICAGWKEGIRLKAIDSQVGYKYRWNTGDTTNEIRINDQGIYRVAYGDACHYHVDSFIVKGSDLITMITVDAFELSSSGGPFAGYQWYRDGELIPGAVKASYTLTANGAYQVSVSDGYGCTFLSEAYVVTNWEGTLAKNALSAQNIRIYPNPAKDKICFQTSWKINVKVTSLEGSMVFNVVDAPQCISIGALPAGMYILSVTDHNGKLVSVEKLVVQ